MSDQWESIIFDDPMSRHPMLPLVVKVMHCIYVTVDPTHPPPPTVMKWRHSQSLSYQVHDHGYEPSIAILNLREGKQDSTMKTLFTINLNTMTVNDRSRNRYFPVPNEIDSVLRDLYEYVRKTVREKKEAEVEEARRREKELEEHRHGVQAFCRCLIDKGLIDEDHAKSFSSDSLQCPLCSAQQTSCSKCKIISCSNSDCVASYAVPIVRCSLVIHHTRQFCTSCLEPPGSLPRLGKCPICLSLFCSGELIWCVGRPNSNDGTVGIATSSNIDVPGTTQVHSARPLSCRNIGCMPNSQDGGRDGRQCCNTDCWSFGMCSTKVCPECITQDSFSCPCGQYWTCGSCKSQSSNIRRPLLLTCSRCHQRFCESCSYIWTCALCRRVGLCKDCLEEESEEVERAPGGNLLFKCQNCQGHLCDACNEGVQSCCTCGRTLCNLCEKDEECERCAHFRQRCNYDYDFFEFGFDGDEMTYHNF